MNQFCPGNDLQPEPKPFSEKCFAFIGGALFFVGSAAVSGALTGYAWRDERWGLLVILGIGVFFVAQWRYQNLVPAALHGLLTGYLAFVIANTWMFSTVFGLFDGSEGVVTGIVQGIHLLHGGLWFLFAIFWWVARRFLRNGWMLAPAIWVLLESVYPGMFPLRAGCMIAQLEPLIQIASVFGIGGVTLQMLLLASLIPLTLFSLKKISESSIGHFLNFNGLEPQTARRTIIVVLAFTMLNATWGAWRMGNIEMSEANFHGARMDVLIVQGETELAQSHANMVERSRRHDKECDLVIWPECSLGHYHQHLNDFSDNSRVYSNSIGINFRFRPLPDPNCFLLGGGYSFTPVANQPDRKKIESKFVSAFLIDPSEKLVGRHDKIELMAGGEYMPGEPWLPALIAWLLPAEEADDEDPFEFDSVVLSRGVAPMPVGDVQLGTEAGEKVSVAALLCCEDMYPWLVRAMVNEGADVLVCVANGVCFDDEIALRQHFRIARFRAIENNRYFLRCGSYGVSGLITPTGKLTHTAPCFTEVDLRVSVPAMHRQLTFFTRFGDTLNWVCLIWIAAVAGWGTMKNRSNRSQISQ